VVRRLTAPLVLAAALAGSAGTAHAQSSPFAPLPQAAPATPTVTTQAPTTTSTDSGLSTGAQVLLFGGGAVLLAAIAWLIVRDARSVAPVEDRAHAPRSGSAPRQDRAQVRRRAKAARQQRKRNR
jgi:hypothetical protein